MTFREYVKYTQACVFEIENSGIYDSSWTEAKEEHEAFFGAQLTFGEFSNIDTYLWICYRKDEVLDIESPDIILTNEEGDFYALYELEDYD